MNFRLIASAIMVSCMLFASSAKADFSYFEDFESLDIGSGTALSDAGWLVGANVYDGSGAFLYNYFSFPAPNGGPAFSAVTTGEGGPDQGNQQVVTYSDYNNADHGNGLLIESFFFREFAITAADVGVYRFGYDLKLGDLVAPTTAYSFAKVIDPNNGFATVLEQRIDVENSPTTWGSNVDTVSIDGSMDGMIFQVGFTNTTTNFTPSGIVYDNVFVSAIPEPSSAGLIALAFAGFVARRRRG